MNRQTKTVRPAKSMIFQRPKTAFLHVSWQKNFLGKKVFRSKSEAYSWNRPRIESNLNKILRIRSNRIIADSTANITNLHPKWVKWVLLLLFSPKKIRFDIWNFSFVFRDSDSTCSHIITEHNFVGGRVRSDVGLLRYLGSSGNDVNQKEQ